MIELWYINKYIRYLGFRLAIEVGGKEPTLIGFIWTGLPGSRRWRKWNELD